MADFDEDAVIEALARMDPRLVAIEARLQVLENAGVVGERADKYSIGYPSGILDEFVLK